MEKRTQDYTKEILEVIRSNISPAVLSKRLQDFHFTGSLILILYRIFWNTLMRRWQSLISKK